MKRLKEFLNWAIRKKDYYGIEFKDVRVGERFWLMYMGDGYTYNQENESQIKTVFGWSVNSVHRYVNERRTNTGERATRLRELRFMDNQGCVVKRRPTLHYLLTGRWEKKNKLRLRIELSSEGKYTTKQEVFTLDRFGEKDRPIQTNISNTCASWDISSQLNIIKGEIKRKAHTMFVNYEITDPIAEELMPYSHIEYDLVVYGKDGNSSKENVCDPDIIKDKSMETISLIK